MPIQSAAFKALRRSEKRRKQNQALKLGLKKLNVRLRKAMTAKQLDQAQEIVRQYTRALDKAVQHGLLHRNTAGRKKSRIAAQLAKAGAV
jgi:small subunit ribosomal protein S20